jgi:hypothetical protein
MNDAQKPASSTTGRASKGFTDEERAAMKERAQELKAAARRSPRADKADGESDVLAKIAEMPEPDRGTEAAAQPAQPTLASRRPRRAGQQRGRSAGTRVETHRRELARPEARRASRGERSRSKEYVGNLF